MTSTPAALAFFTDPMRLGMCERHAGRQHQRRKLPPSPRSANPPPEPRPWPRRARPGVAIVPGSDLGPASDQRLRAVAVPEAPRPSTATVCPESRDADHRSSGPASDTESGRPESRATGSRPQSPTTKQSLAKLQRRQADQRQNHRDDPEAHHHGRLSPALLLVVVVQRRHSEHALARQLVMTPPG